MNIHVHIERLVLDGLPIATAQGPLVQAAVEAELARLFTDRGLIGLSHGAVPYLSGGSIQLASNSEPSRVGHQIAHAVHSSINPQPFQT